MQVSPQIVVVRYQRKKGKQQRIGESHMIALTIFIYIRGILKKLATQSIGTGSVTEYLL